MSYELEFLELAFAEWNRLDRSIAVRLRKKLERRQIQPRLENQRLTGSLALCYKVRDDKSGYRLIYLVEEDTRLLVVISIGQRRELEAYRVAAQRIIDR